MNFLEAIKISQTGRLLALVVLLLTINFLSKLSNFPAQVSSTGEGDTDSWGGRKGKHMGVLCSPAVNLNREREREREGYEFV